MRAKKKEEKKQTASKTSFFRKISGKTVFNNTRLLLLLPRKKIVATSPFLKISFSRLCEKLIKNSVPSLLSCVTHASKKIIVILAAPSYGKKRKGRASLCRSELFLFFSGRIYGRQMEEEAISGDKLGGRERDPPSMNSGGGRFHKSAEGIFFNFIFMPRCLLRRIFSAQKKKAETGKDEASSSLTFFLE